MRCWQVSASHPQPKGNHGRVMQAMQNPNLLLCTMLDSTFQPPAWGFCGAGVCNSHVHAAPSRWVRCVALLSLCSTAQPCTLPSACQGPAGACRVQSCRCLNAGMAELGLLLLGPVRWQTGWAISHKGAQRKPLPEGFVLLPELFFQSWCFQGINRALRAGAALG